MATKTFSRTTRRVVTTTLVAALAAVGMAVPAVAAAQPGEGSFQRQVDAVQRTGTVGVLARSTGPRGVQFATAGVADAETKRKARPGDKFRIASATKTYVSTVVLQLVGEGRLSLDDTVEDVLPGVVSGNGNDGSRITVRQLLNHTSGLFNYTADFPALSGIDAYEAGRYTTWTDEQLVEIAMRHAPDFEPGAKWSYSNTNYTLAGMIIEKITGRTWQQEVTKRVIRPLGLRDTLTPTTSARIPGSHLKGYSAFGESAPAIDVTAFNPSAAGAAGAMISTAGDMTTFYQALMSGRLLKPAQLTEMKKTVRAAELDEAWPGARYGLGLMEIPLTCGGSYFSHAGDLPGYATRTGATEDGRRVVVLEATGDGSMPGSIHATNTLIDKQLCAGRAK
ncbi:MULTISPECIES: serine hydrolase domain-containing protein [Streptomyces]|uniref:serine hydrolase domain-containing protein n=1 Tax=Streptomyces TaxID=1883 RepID=UPI00084C9540|nr:MULTISPECIES: serine hydrolase domain-containing protein [Streptomyces]TFI25646.1 class A beta-lactamase-related serine hydrolase [Streptomyces sp. 4R-3d]